MQINDVLSFEKESEVSRIKLLKNLRHNTYCRIGLSKISGVGVLAIKAIDANIDPFQTVYKLDTSSIDLSVEEVENLDPGVSILIKDFFMLTPEGTYPVYFNGLNAMDIAYYLNHSDYPNVVMVYEQRRDNDEPTMITDPIQPMYDLAEYYTFKTIRPIVPGEELTIDYYQHAKSLAEILQIRKQFKLPFPSYALKPKHPF